MGTLISTSPIAYTRGDTLKRLFRFKDSDGNAVDLTGYSIANWEIKWRNGSLPLTVANGRLSLALASGEITVTVSDTDAVDIPEGQLSKIIGQLTDTASAKLTHFIKPIKVTVP